MIRSLLSQISSMAVALLIAVIVWSVATAEENPSREGQYPDSLPIQIVNIPEGMVVFQQSATTVRLKIRAPVGTWDQLNPSSFRVLADLKGLDVGVHQVAVNLESVDPRVVVVNVDPQTVGIRLEKLQSKVFNVHSDVLDAPPPGYTASVPSTTPAQVMVSGAGVLVDQITEVVADLFLRGAKAPFDRDVTLVARDAQGNAILGVAITPPTVTARVQVEQRVGYKDVSIKTVLKGTVAPGFWVSNVVVSPSTATIVGSADVLAKIPGFVETLPIDVSGATADVTKRTALALPESVSILDNPGFSVQVSVTPIMGGQTFPRQITVQGLRRGLNISISPASADVILSGPLPALQSLQLDDVQVVIDATTLGAGTYQLKPHVLVVPDSLKVQNIVPDTVQVTIVDLYTPTSTPTPTTTPTPTITSTPPSRSPTPSRTPTQIPR